MSFDLSASGFPRLGPVHERAEICVGMVAPDFELEDSDGQTVQLSALRGRSLVIIFFRRDW